MGKFGASFIWSVRVWEGVYVLVVKGKYWKFNSADLRALREWRVLKKTVYRICLHLNIFLQHIYFVKNIIFDVTLLCLEKLPFEISKCYCIVSVKNPVFWFKFTSLTTSWAFSTLCPLVSPSETSTGKLSRMEVTQLLHIVPTGHYFHEVWVYN